MANYQKHISPGQFIADTDLIRLIEEGNHDEIDKLKLLYPENIDLINDTITLVTCLKIEQPDVPQQQIDNDLGKLMLEIKKRKNKNKKKRIYLWAASAAACFAIFVSVFLYRTGNNNHVADQQSILLESAKLEPSGDDVLIITGNGQTTIDNEQTITQTESGDLLVGNEEKLNSSDIKTEYITIMVPKGKRTTIQFSDGSKAWINSGSKLVYPKIFAEKSRDITIDGEIYLDVVKNTNKPFYVHTKNFAVEVLGTQFNISAYSDDTENSVVLVEGAVEITTGNSKGKLAPNQGFFTKDNSHAIKNVDVYPYICWKDNLMKIQDESLDIIMKKLSRHYGVDIQLVNGKYADEKYRGKIDLSKSIETVLNNIAISTPMHYTRNGDVIVIN